jgi:hypothetical protein
MTSAVTDAAAVVPPDPGVGTDVDPGIMVVGSDPGITVIGSDDISVVCDGPHRLLRSLVLLGLAAAVVLTTLAMMTARHTPSAPLPSPVVAPAGATPLQPVTTTP